MPREAMEAVGNAIHEAIARGGPAPIVIPNPGGSVHPLTPTGGFLPVPRPALPNPGGGFGNPFTNPFGNKPSLPDYEPTRPPAPPPVPTGQTDAPHDPTEVPGGPGALPPSGAPTTTGFSPAYPPDYGPDPMATIPGSVPWGGTTNYPPSSGSTGLGGIVNAGCGLLPAGVARDICKAASGLIDPRGAGITTNTGACPSGYKWNGKQCVVEGVGGVVSRALPGGSTGVLDYGAAVVGAFGIPALQPAQVGTIARKDGSQGPIFRCPPGAILGRDSLCYMKGSIPRGFRKNPPAARPLLSAMDGKILTRARGLEKKLKRVSGKFVHKPCAGRRAPARKR